jgi:DnaJ like chaperone protein
MAKYEKWLGAGLGWVLTGNPLGSIVGFLAGALVENGQENKSAGTPAGMTEFETNLIVLATHLIKIDGRVTLEEINFTQNFLSAHFDEKFTAERNRVIHHCLNKEYDLNLACDRLRSYSSAVTRAQIVHFLFDLATCDGPLHEHESYFIFRIAGYLNVNDVEYRRIRAEHTTVSYSVYDVLGVKRETTFAEIRTTYRKLTLKYHPDRNQHLTEKEKKELAQKFQHIKEAYERIKEERAEK